MRRDKNSTVWLNLGFIPGRVGFCPSAKAWDKVMKEIGDDKPYPGDKYGCCNWWEGPHDLVVLITIGDQADRRDVAIPWLSGVVAHECMHAWRMLRQFIGESEPSMEFEAYAMQGLVQQTIEAYNATRKRLWR